MIAATADTRPPLGSALSARPPALPCLPLPRRRAGHQRNGFSFFLSGRQCLGRSGREDERQDLFVVHWHSGLAFCPWSHITAALPARVFWAGGCLCIPVPTDKQGQSLRAPHFLSSAGPGRAVPTVLESHTPGDRALGRDSHGHVPTCPCPLWDRQPHEWAMLCWANTSPGKG